MRCDIPFVDNAGPNSKPASRAVLAGVALGALLALPAILAAIGSAAAGQGNYVAARALFPMSMLLTLVEGRIGGFSIAVAALQFPAYGALLGWAVAAKTYRPAILVASAHLIGAILCFAGTLPNFS